MVYDATFIMINKLLYILYSMVLHILITQTIKKNILKIIKYIIGKVSCTKRNLIRALDNNSSSVIL